MKSSGVNAAFILHRRPYRDTSLLLELFSRNEGRVTVVAKGARRPKSTLKNAVQLFQPLQVSWQGQQELANLIYAEIEQSLPPFPAQYLPWGFYLNELIYRLLGKFDPYPELFDYYEQLITNLAHNQAHEKQLRLFERELLTELGYGLQLTQEADTHLPLDATAYYHFIPTHGPVRTQIDERNHYVFQGKTLLALANNELNERETLHDAKRLLRLALNALLGDKPIKSRELLQ
jgi:DNA repair protein RecO (recombination protein O)